MQSRHVTVKQYDIYIQYIPHLNDASGITGWYCKCRSGARHVGYCSHICAVLYHIGFRRHDPTWRKPSANVGINIIDPANRDSSPEYDEEDVEIIPSTSRGNTLALQKRKRSQKRGQSRVVRGRGRSTPVRLRLRPSISVTKGPKTNESEDYQPVIGSESS